MNEIRPSLWFDGNAEEAAEFYCRVFPNSRIDKVVLSPAKNPSTEKGEVVVVEFTLNGRQFCGINGGPQFHFTEAVSFEIECENQAEVDRYWELLTSEGGTAGQCGWCKDKFGLSWQVTPKRLREMFGSPDREAAERAMQAMLQMHKIDVAALEGAFAGSDAPSGGA